MVYCLFCFHCCLSRRCVALLSPRPWSHTTGTRRERYGVDIGNFSHMVGGTQLSKSYLTLASMWTYPARKLKVIRFGLVGVGLDHCLLIRIFFLMLAFTLRAIASVSRPQRVEVM